MKYLIGSYLKGFDIFVLDGANSGEYESNDPDLTLEDLSQLHGAEVGASAILVETPEVESEIKLLVESYDPETNHFKKGIHINAKTGAAEKAKIALPEVLKKIDDGRALRIKIAKEKKLRAGVPIQYVEPEKPIPETTEKPKAEIPAIDIIPIPETTEKPKEEKTETSKKVKKI